MVMWVTWLFGHKHPSKPYKIRVCVITPVWSHLGYVGYTQKTKSDKDKKDKGRTNMVIPQMTAGQNKALEAMLSGRNVFLTGGAGTGKSTAVELFIEMAFSFIINIVNSFLVVISQVTTTTWLIEIELRGRSHQRVNWA